MENLLHLIMYRTYIYIYDAGHYPTRECQKISQNILSS